MRKIILFAGTTEGRQLAEALTERECEVDAFVVSSYGREVLPKNERLHVHVGRLNEEEMAELFERLKPDLIIDATHPYAAAVTQNIYQAALGGGHPYIRIRRSTKEEAKPLSPHEIVVSDARAAADFLKHTDGNIFLTTGSKELAEFTVIDNYEERLYARVLPSAAVASLCENIGIRGRHLIMMQGPFSTEMNHLMLKETKARWMVTKNSGKIGGFEEKCEAAQALGVGIVVIGKPQEQIPKERVYSVTEALAQLHSLCKMPPASARRDIYLIGMGPGNTDLISEEALEAIHSSQLLIGAKRMVDMALAVSEPNKEVFVSYQIKEIDTYLKRHPAFSKIAFLYSGDIDICSGAQSIEALFDEKDRIVKIHGISSVDYIARLCGYRREELFLTSVHGRKEDVASAVESHPAVVTLLGGSASLQQICRELLEKKQDEVQITLGENLSYPNEVIRRGVPADFVHAEIASLSVAVFEWQLCQRTQMPRIMLAAPKSGSGKTTVTCGLIGALSQRMTVSSFKCGPDYIDPMFHAAVLGVKTGNLDSYFTEPESLERLFLQRAAGSDMAVIEGVMGYYDGLGGTTQRASSCEVASITQTPVVLVIDAKGASMSLVPLILGMVEFHAGKSLIGGVILNRVSKGFYPRLRDMLSEEFKKRKLSIAVLGYLPEDEALAVPSRHLGLVTPKELTKKKEWAQQVAEAVNRCVDVDGIIRLARQAKSLPRTQTAKESAEQPVGRRVRLAVAKDEAFSFYYAENEEVLRELGAEIVYFSPLHDAHFPKEIDGLILGGGYPELYRRELAENETMRNEIRQAIGAKLPTIAECGGFLYLQEALTSLDGKSYPMCGVLQSEGFETEHLVRFGYCEGETTRDGLFGKKGMFLKGHEFHYWDCFENGDGLALKKPVGNRSWKAMVYTDHLAAGFVHFYYPANREAIAHFLKVCRRETEHDGN